MKLKEKLLSSRLGTGKVTIEGVGDITVRALTRQEMIALGDIKDQMGFERKMLALAMVDPALTEDEILIWQKCSPANEINPVTEEINKLSGIGRAAERAAYKSV